MSRRSSRTPVRTDIQFAAIRILIASFFVAVAVQMVPYPSLYGLTDQIVSEKTSVTIATTFVFVTSFFMMVGRNVQTACVSLAVFLLASNLAFEVTNNAPLALADFWLTVVFVGMLVLIALTRPGGSEDLYILRKIVTPRRIRTQPRRGEVVRPSKPEIQEKPAVEAKPVPEPTPTFSSSRTINPFEAEQNGLRLIHDADSEDQSNIVVEDRLANAS